MNPVLAQVRSEAAGTPSPTVPHFGTRLWRLADPKISLASFASMFLGA